MERLRETVLSNEDESRRLARGGRYGRKKVFAIRQTSTQRWLGQSQGYFRAYPFVYETFEEARRRVAVEKGSLRKQQRVPLSEVKTDLEIVELSFTVRYVSPQP